MKKIFLFGAMVCAFGMMTACKSGTANTPVEEFPEVGKDFKILLVEDHNICKSYFLQILTDTTYTEDYLMYFANKFRSEYAPNENSTILVYDTAFSVDFIKHSILNPNSNWSDEEFLTIANHELLISEWSDTTYGYYHMLKNDERYKQLTNQK